MVDILMLTTAVGAVGTGYGVVLAVGAAAKIDALKAKLAALKAKIDASEAHYRCISREYDISQSRLRVLDQENPKLKQENRSLDRENLALAKALIEAKDERDAAQDEIARRREQARTAAMKGRCSQAAARRGKAA